MRFDGEASSWNHAAAPQSSTTQKRRGWLPLAAVRPDYDLIPLNGDRLITSGIRRRPATGTISAVAFRAELRPSSREVISHLLSSEASVVARSRILGGMSVDDYEALGERASVWSMDSATAAAASVLGMPVAEAGSGALVDGLRFDTVGLCEHELITAVEGQQVSTAAEVRSALAGRNSAQLTVLGGPSDRKKSRTVRLVRHSDGAWGIRVITAERVLAHGLDARFELPEDLRGPSLGLACALSIIDAYTGGDLVGSGTLVATGTVDMAGRVGGVGAIEYKARAVRAHPHVRRFIVPAESASDVEDARRVLGGRVEVVAVTTLAEAVEVVSGRTWRVGKVVPRSADRRASTVLQ
jgi:PDZ domain-containing secreted protein